MARFTGGWYKVHREVWEKDISQNLILWALWNALLCMAVYKDTQILWEGKQRIIPAGTVVFGISEIATRWRVSNSVIKKWLRHLAQCDRIVIESCPRGTLVTICNWEHFQVFENQACLQRDDNETTTSLQRVHNESLNEEVQEEKKEERRKKNSPTGILADYPPVFVTLWDSYGKVGKKAAALKVFQKLKLSDEEVEKLKEAIKNYYARKEEWRSPQHFSTFLNDDWRIYLEPQEAVEHINRNNIFDFLPHNQKKASS